MLKNNDVMTIDLKTKISRWSVIGEHGSKLCRKEGYYMVSLMKKENSGQDKRKVETKFLRSENI